MPGKTLHVLLPALLLLLFAAPVRAGAPAAATGSLAVSFSHGGLSWFVDGKRQATSPFASHGYVLARLGAGSHQLRITDPTGKAMLWEGSFSVRAGSTTRATIQPNGTLSFEAPATGEEQAQTPTEVAWPAPAGNPGQQAPPRTIAPAPLPGQPPPAGVAMGMQVGPQGATVWAPGMAMQAQVDPGAGAAWGAATPPQPPAGSPPGWGPPLPPPQAMPPQAVPGALLFLSQDAEWCDVYVDGEKRGELRNNERVMVEGLPVGMHTVEVRGFMQPTAWASQQLPVHPGFTTNLAVRKGAPLQVMNRP